MWATYTAEPYAEVGFLVPLEFTTMPPQLEISGDVPTAVHVRVRGRSALLRRMVPADLNLRLDMKDGKQGTTTMRFHARNGGRPVWRDRRASCSLGNPRYSCATPRPRSSRRMTGRVLDSKISRANSSPRLARVAPAQVEPAP